MAIYSKETKFVDKYFKEYEKALKHTPKEELEQMFDFAFSYLGNYEELSWNEKMQFAKWDFKKIVEVILDRYQDEYGHMTAPKEVVIDDLQVVLEPMRKGNVLFYSRALKRWNNAEMLFDKDVLSPAGIVEDLEDKEEYRIFKRIEEIYFGGN